MRLRDLKRVLDHLARDARRIWPNDTEWNALSIDARVEVQRLDEVVAPLELEWLRRRAKIEARRQRETRRRFESAKRLLSSRI